MALRPLNSSVRPLGEFDGYDDEYTLFKGGEVCTLVGVALGTDESAKDVDDGYSGVNAGKVRPMVTFSLTSGDRPLFLADEGIAGYGTLFGQVVGGITGQVVEGAQLGPSSATGSGKVTCWDKPGLFAVTLDAVDDTADTGLVPENANLAPGVALYATAEGLLTPDAGSAFESVVVARFVEFSTNGSLVTTPGSLVGRSDYFTEVVLNFNPEV